MAMGDGSPFEWTHPSTWPWMIRVWIAFLLIGWIAPLWKWFQRNRASSWAIADARIESVEVTKPGFSFTTKRGYYAARLGYSYSVSGSVHSGIYKRDVPTQREADEFARDLKGKPVPAHYDPGKPSRSVLLESDIQTLLQTRAPVEGTETVDTTLIPDWTKQFLWLFIGISAIGLGLSLWVHIGAVMGRRVVPQQWFWMLHVGIFIVWFPAVFVAQRLVGGVNRKDFWKVVLKNCPDWMRYMIYGFFGYAMINSLLFMAKASKGGIGSSPTTDWRGFSGMWMIFYSAALGILYSAAATVNAGHRCSNGHLLSADSPNYCARCGLPVGRFR